MGGDWSRFLPEGDIYVTITGVFVVVTALWATAKRVRKATAKRLDPIVEQCRKALLVINGREAITLPENPGVVVAEPVKGALERLEAIEQAQGSMMVHIGKVARDVTSLTHEVHEVKGEVKHNGGGSIKDAVKRIEERGTEIVEKVQANTQHLGSIDARLEEGNQRFDEIEDVLSNQQEADKAMWQAIEAIAKSEPPTEPRVDPPGDGYAEL